MIPKRAPGEPVWFYRRIVLFATLAYCAAFQWRLIGAEDTRLHDTMASVNGLLMGALVLGYLGFATVQDVAAFRTSGTALPYAPPPPTDPMAAPPTGTVP